MPTQNQPQIAYTGPHEGAAEDIEAFLAYLEQKKAESQSLEKDSEKADK